MDQRRTCTLCSEIGIDSLFVKIKVGRFDVLKDINPNTKSINDFAHLACLKMIGLDVAPKGKGQCAVYKNLFWTKMKNIVRNTFELLKQNGDLDEENPGASVMHHLRLHIPIETPTAFAIDEMTKIIDKIVEQKTSRSMQVVATSSNEQVQAEHVSIGNQMQLTDFDFRRIPFPLQSETFAAAIVHLQIKKLDTDRDLEASRLETRRIEVDLENRRLQTDIEIRRIQADAEVRRAEAEAEAKRIELELKKVDADQKRVELENRRVEIEASVERERIKEEGETQRLQMQLQLTQQQSSSEGESSAKRPRYSTLHLYFSLLLPQDCGEHHVPTTSLCGLQDVCLPSQSSVLCFHVVSQCGGARFHRGGHSRWCDGQRASADGEMARGGLRGIQYHSASLADPVARAADEVQVLDISGRATGPHCFRAAQLAQPSSVIRQPHVGPAGISRHVHPRSSTKN